MLIEVRKSFRPEGSDEVQILVIPVESRLYRRFNRNMSRQKLRAHAVLPIQFAFNILTYWNLSIDKVLEKVLDHIKFISEYAKSVKGGENQ